MKSPPPSSLATMITVLSAASWLSMTNVFAQSRPAPAGVSGINSSFDGGPQDASEAIFPEIVYFTRPEAQRPSREEAVHILGDPKSNPSSITDALQTLRAQGSFSKDVAWALFTFLSRAEAKPLREEASKILVDIVGYLQDDFDSAGQFLLDVKVISGLRQFLVGDPDPEVRRLMANLSQTMTFGFVSNATASNVAITENLAKRYVPILIDALGPEEDGDQRHEIIVALENFKDALKKINDNEFFRTNEIQESLKKQLVGEPDEDNQSDIRALLEP